MEVMNIGDIVFQMIFILLIVLFFVSLTLYVRRISINQRKRVQNNAKIEQKLDRIIELLEQGKLNK
ncbi:DUF4083 domain-containing protein [Siminovitchia fortis]|uniref:DUF4083 domain-containing protein n=2 Tax=Siminovitchia fortis TaxID=254758 RepID=UPI0028CB574C|nr:DUF4083 domain-containing protein [Siminovitchia fortis]